MSLILHLFEIKGLYPDAEVDSHDDGGDLGIVGDDVQDFSGGNFSPAAGVETICLEKKVNFLLELEMENPYQSTFYNGTIEVTEVGGLLSVESVFLFCLAVALLGLLGIWLRGQIQNFSKKTKRVAKVEVGTGTTDGNMDEWLQHCIDPTKASLAVCDNLSVSVMHRVLRLLPTAIMSSTFSGDETAPFFGFLGAAAALVFSCMGAAYGTAKSGVGVASMGVMRPELVMKSIVPVVMAGVLGIYGLIIAVIISTGINPKAKSYYLFDGYAHLSSGLACGLAGLAAGMAIGIVGDAGVRANAQQPKLFVGMILILIFAEALALYGLIVGIILSSRAGQSRAD
ncbi:hypothetical protein SASPL_135849 [Salvia splendens]|uniref:V-type proton ATPase proteolipid subunit n=17 Tax=Lamiales TaxID=4143 RepID=A0A8X8X0X4_SALSN|nr:hypothetical protein SASPL_135849 [Salvia splendens]